MEMNDHELLVWWGDALLDAQHGRRVRSNWCDFDDVAIVLRPTRLEHAPSKPAAFLALLPITIVVVASLGAGAWLQHTDARALHERAIAVADPVAPTHRTTTNPSWVPPELCVPPPSPSDQDDEWLRIEHDARAEHVAYSPRGELGSSEGPSPMRQEARSPRARTIADVLESVDWARPASVFQNALESRAGDELWTAGGLPGAERIRIRGTGTGGGGTGVGTVSLGRLGTIGFGPVGRRGCTHMCCFQRCNGRWRHGPVAEVRLGTTTVIGGLEQNVVRRIQRRHVNELRHCYEIGLQTDDDLEGAITIQYFISPHGNVRSAIVAHSDLDHEGVEACFVAAVHRWMFVEPTNRAMVSVSQPFHLRLRR